MRRRGGGPASTSLPLLPPGVRTDHSSVDRKRCARLAVDRHLPSRPAWFTEGGPVLLEERRARGCIQEVMGCVHARSKRLVAAEVPPLKHAEVTEVEARVVALDDDVTTQVIEWGQPRRAADRQPDLGPFVMNELISRRGSWRDPALSGITPPGRGTRRRFQRRPSPRRSGWDRRRCCRPRRSNRSAPCGCRPAP